MSFKRAANVLMQICTRFEVVKARVKAQVKSVVKAQVKSVVKALVKSVVKSLSFRT